MLGDLLLPAKYGGVVADLSRGFLFLPTGLEAVAPIYVKDWADNNDKGIGGYKMKEMIEEYAGVIAGSTAAVAILGIALEFVLGGAGLYEIVLWFSKSIC